MERFCKRKKIDLKRRGEARWVFLGYWCNAVHRSENVPHVPHPLRRWRAAVAAARMHSFINKISEDALRLWAIQTKM